MTTAQRTVSVKRRKQIWEALHPEAKRQRAADLDDDGEQVGQVVPPVAKHGRPQTKGFAADTASSSGMTKRSINRALANAEAIGDESLEAIVGTSLDKGVELDALARMPAEKRQELIVKAAAGEVVTARAEAIGALACRRPGACAAGGADAVLAADAGWS